MNEHTQKGHIAPGNGPPAARSRIVRAVAVASWLYLASALAAWALLYQGDLKWPATLLMFSPRWLLALPALVLALAAARWQRRSLVPVLIGLAVVLGPVMGLNVPWEDLTSEAPEGPRLRVLTCNMHYGRGDREALGALVMHSRPDVVALQEWRDKELPDALTGPYWHIRRSPGLFLASNSPIRSSEVLGDHAGNPKGLVGRYELETPAGVVTFFSLHLESPRHALVGVAHDSETGPANLQANSDLRRSQSVWVAGEAVGVRGPVVLAGDFNTPPESDLFRTVWASYTDAFSAAGWGWGHTFIGGRTAVRIDHVLMGRGWRCRRCRVGPWIGSPHRPVIADLVWVGESGSALRQIRE